MRAPPKLRYSPYLFDVTVDRLSWIQSYPESILVASLPGAVTAWPLRSPSVTEQEQLDLKIEGLPMVIPQITEPVRNG